MAQDTVEVIGTQALGMIETRGLVASIEAADAMVKGRKRDPACKADDRRRLCGCDGAWRRGRGEDGAGCGP